MPSVPPTAIVPVAKPVIVAVAPEFGQAARPKVAVVATDEPQIAPNAVQAPITAMASPPRRWPTNAPAARNSAVGEPGSLRESAHQDEERDHRKRVVGELVIGVGLHVGEERRQPDGWLRRSRSAPTTSIDRPTGMRIAISASIATKADGGHRRRRS